MSKEVEILRNHIRTHRTVLSMCGEPEDVVLNRLLDDFEEQENKIAELEEQLKNAIVPKFKIGQEVWIVRGKENRRVDKCKVYGFVNNQCIRLTTSNKTHITRDLINTFITKEEAEQKLKEIKNGQTLFR